MYTKVLLVIIGIVQISRVNSFANNIPGQCIDIGSLTIEPLAEISKYAGEWYTMLESTAGPNVESEQSRTIQSQASDPDSYCIIERFTDLLTQKNEETIYNVTEISSSVLRFSLILQDDNNDVENGFDCAVLHLTDTNMISYCCKNETEITKTEEYALHTRDVSQSLQTFIDLAEKISNSNNLMASYDYSQLVYRKDL